MQPWVKPFGSRHAETARWLERHGMPVCPATIGDRIPFQDAYARGCGVCETEPRGKAATETRAVYEFANRQLDIARAPRSPAASPCRRPLSMSRRPNIAGAMREAAGSTRARPVPAQTSGPAAAAPADGRTGRAGTRAITAHFPPAVRYQLRLLAAEQGRTMQDMLAEALNLLFAAHNRPETAPVSRPRDD